jgi:hypothetical protein
MYDILNILNNYVSAIKETQSPEIIVSNIRSFTKLLQSTALQPIISTLKEQKYNDLTDFQKAFATFQDNKKNAFLLILEFVNKTPFLQKHLPGELWAQNISHHFIFFEPFVKLDIRRFNEDLQRLVRILVDYGYLDFAHKFVETVLFTPLYRSKFDDNGKEKLINPLGVLCHEQELGAFIFSKALDECCREAEIIRSKMNTVLWNDLDELFQYYTWTNSGLPSIGFSRDTLLKLMRDGHVVERINRIYSYILENKHLILSEFDPRSLLDLQLFFDEANRNVWIVGKRMKGSIEPLLLHELKSEGGRFDLMCKLKNASPGTIIEHKDFEKCRNRIGFTKKTGLLQVFFEKSKSNDGYNTYKGHVVRLTSENMDLKTIFTTLTELWVQQRKLEEEVPFPYQLYYSKYF